MYAKELFGDFNGVMEEGPEARNIRTDREFGLERSGLTGDRGDFLILP
jgi:hypothetical protein